jgi:ectoine hydroxylase-related dioxygenase (phytanoyl-CoA dioxygenase family)
MTTQVESLQDEFQSQGYAILRGVIEPAVQAKVREELSAVVDFLADTLCSQYKVPHPHKGESFETRLVKLYEGRLDEAPPNLRYYAHRPGIHGLFFHPGLLDVIESILGQEVRLYPNYSIRPKFPDWKGTEVLWHQDGGYTSAYGNTDGSEVGSMRMVNVWSPLVHARVENGCMQFIPGSHKLGPMPHAKKEFYLEIEQQHMAPHIGKAINVEVDPGDVVLFDNLMMHRGLPNRSSKIRWSLDWRYQDATQSTMRKEQGHMARSRRDPSSVVRDGEQWASLWFS